MLLIVQELQLATAKLEVEVVVEGGVVERQVGQVIQLILAPHLQPIPQPQAQGMLVGQAFLLTASGRRVVFLLRRVVMEIQEIKEAMVLLLFRGR
jgi:hypothetical protein